MRGSSTNFGIFNGNAYANASVIKQRVYTGVLQGFTSANIGTSSGTYDGMSWSLVEEGSSGNWDLLFSGVSTYGTQSSLQSQSSNLMSAFNLQKAAINLGLNYDCTTFDSNGVCVGIGGRYTSLDSNSQFNNSSAIVVTSIKLAEYIRIGGYLDQNVSSKLKDISLSNNKGPLGGLFVVLSENDKTREGYELRLAANYQSKHADISREVIGNSEAGSGNASLESMGALGQISYSLKQVTRFYLHNI